MVYVVYHHSCNASFLKILNIALAIAKISLSFIICYQIFSWYQLPSVLVLSLILFDYRIATSMK